MYSNSLGVMCGAMAELASRVAAGFCEQGVQRECLLELRVASHARVRQALCQLPSNHEGICGDAISATFKYKWQLALKSRGCQDTCYWDVFYLSVSLRILFSAHGCVSGEGGAGLRNLERCRVRAGSNSERRRNQGHW